MTSHGDSENAHYGLRIEAGRSWTVYHVFTGVPADIHLRESASAAPIEAAANRAKLAAQLYSERPDFIVDGLGPYNPQLAMEQYPELQAVLTRLYRRDPAAPEIGHGRIYRRIRASRANEASLS